jgi:hypothetical protein
LEDTAPYGVHMPKIGTGGKAVNTVTIRCFTTLIHEQHEISIQMIRDTADSFDSRAERLLNSMGVPDLTDEEVNSIIA